MSLHALEEAFGDIDERNDAIPVQTEVLADDQQVIAGGLDDLAGLELAVGQALDAVVTNNIVRSRPCLIGLFVRTHGMYHCSLGKSPLDHYPRHIGIMCSLLTMMKKACGHG